MATNQVQSLQRAIQLLEAMDSARRPMTLHELAEESGLVKSTVHRLLATLREADLVEQLADGRYALGLHLFEMGCSAGYMRDIVFIARPYMQAIWQQTNESVSLSLLSQGEALVLSFIESTNTFRVVARTGSKLPVHCTVQGKIMLAHMTRAEVKRILREHGMQAYTANTKPSAALRSWSRSCNGYENRGTPWTTANSTLDFAPWRRRSMMRTVMSAMHSPLSACFIS